MQTLDPDQGYIRDKIWRLLKRNTRWIFFIFFPIPGGDFRHTSRCITIRCRISRDYGEGLAEEVQALYESAGLVIDEEVEFVPDHLFAELLFMSYLIENHLMEQQKFFLEDHLLTWVLDYCDEIKRIARTSFYKRVAELLNDFILDECEEFGIETDL